MIVRKINEIPPFLAGDKTMIRELLHPDKDKVDIPYSLALATLSPGEKSVPHILHTTEAYLLIKGKGRVWVNETSAELCPGDVVFIPSNAVQYIENTGEEPLAFFCVVSPPWAPHLERIL